MNFNKVDIGEFVLCYFAVFAIVLNIIPLFAAVIIKIKGEKAKKTYGYYHVFSLAIEYAYFMPIFPTVFWLIYGNFFVFLLTNKYISLAINWLFFLSVAVGYVVFTRKCKKLKTEKPDKTFDGLLFLMVLLIQCVVLTICKEACI